MNQHKPKVSKSKILTLKKLVQNLVFLYSLYFEMGFIFTVWKNMLSQSQLQKLSQSKPRLNATADSDKKMEMDFILGTEAIKSFE